MQTTSAAPFRNLVMPVLMRMLYGCGLRVSEALNLTVKDVDLENGILYIRHAKNDKERLVPMSASLTEKCRTFSEKAHLNSKDKGTIELQLCELLRLNMDIRLKVYADIRILSHFDIIPLSELLYDSIFDKALDLIHIDHIS